MLCMRGMHQTFSIQQICNVRILEINLYSNLMYHNYLSK